MIAMLRTLFGALFILVAFFAAIYFAIYYSPNPVQVSGGQTGSSSENFTIEDWEATWEWSTVERINYAYAVVVVKYEKNWFGYHKAILSEVLKPSDGDERLPPIGSEFEYASFHRTDSQDYGDGAVFLFYDHSQPIQEGYIHYAGGVLRDDEATTLARIRELVEQDIE